MCQHWPDFEYSRMPEIYGPQTKILERVTKDEMRISDPSGDQTIAQFRAH